MPLEDAYVRVLGYDDATTQTILNAGKAWSRYGFRAEPWDGQSGDIVIVVHHVDKLPGAAAAFTYCGDNGCDIQVSIATESDSFESILRHEFGHALVSGSHLAPGEKGLMAPFIAGPTPFSTADDAWVCMNSPAHCLQ